MTYIYVQRTLSLIFIGHANTSCGGLGYCPVGACYGPLVITLELKGLSQMVLSASAMPTCNFLRGSHNVIAYSINDPIFVSLLLQKPFDLL